MRCQHMVTEAGPRFPLRWGSAPTIICRRCGDFSVDHHGYGPWKPGPIADAIREILEEGAV